VERQCRVNLFSLDETRLAAATESRNHAGSMGKITSPSGPDRTSGAGIDHSVAAPRAGAHCLLADARVGIGSPNGEVCNIRFDGAVTIVGDRAPNVHRALGCDHQSLGVLPREIFVRTINGPINRIRIGTVKAGVPLYGLHRGTGGGRAIEADPAGFIAGCGVILWLRRELRSRTDGHGRGHRRARATWPFPADVIRRGLRG
jgi:hypothetical protein